MLISIVTGTFQRLPLLMKMIASARASVPEGIPLEFVIVDGGSTDGTIEWCKEHSREYQITLLEHGELRGAIRAFTEGAYAARGRYIVLANDDIQFRGDSILRALLYLEQHPTSGAVAFADNRPSFGKEGYQVMPMPAMRHGRAVSVPYAQVGMFRKRLGDSVGWWGADDPAFTARTYGGDNYLSSGIWQLGYSVDPVKGVEVDDSVHDDDLRKINGSHQPDGTHSDSDKYYARYPHGADIPDAPLVDNPDKERLRILYLPVYEPGHEVQRLQKKGLREALLKRGWVTEVDFLSIKEGRLYDDLKQVILSYQPHLMVSQIQAPEPMNATVVSALRALLPSMVWVNWNGDVYPGGLTSPAMLSLLKWVDLQLTVNADVLPVYHNAGIPAGYWQIGYEEPGDGLPEVPPSDVVFLANAYEPQRAALENELSERGFSVAFYGSGWGRTAGFTLYDFAAGKAIYRSAKIALGDNQFGMRGFVSNRMFQAMAAGGCLYMQQHVPGLEDLTGLQHGIHYIEWRDTDDLRAKIDYYLSHESERARIADAGTAHVREFHSFDARVNELFTSLLPLAKRRPREMVTLNYRGSRSKPFGVAGHGMYTPGESLRLPADDATLLMIQFPELWERVESEMG